ncbi:hypothetical protein L9F63_007749, partial [Diploptera punctata]
YRRIYCTILHFSTAAELQIIPGSVEYLACCSSACDDVITLVLRYCYKISLPNKTECFNTHLQRLNDIQYISDKIKYSFLCCITIFQTTNSNCTFGGSLQSERLDDLRTNAACTRFTWWEGPFYAYARYSSVKSMQNGKIYRRLTPLILPYFGYADKTCCSSVKIFTKCSWEILRFEGIEINNKVLSLENLTTDIEKTEIVLLIWILSGNIYSHYNRILIGTEIGNKRQLEKTYRPGYI